jgi:hypothetical protein
MESLGKANRVGDSRVAWLGQGVRMACDAPSTAIKHLTGVARARFDFGLPTKAEQHEIVRYVELLFACAGRLAVRLAAALAQVEQITPSLLAKAFRGELMAGEVTTGGEGGG